MNKTLVRTLSGVLFVGVMVGCLLGGPLWFLVLFLAIMIKLLGEFYRISLGDKQRTAQGLAIFSAVSAFVVVYLLHASGRPLPARYLSLIPVLLVLLMGTMVLQHKDFKDYAYILAGWLYIALPMALSPLVAIRPDGSYRGILMLAFFILIWASDTGAYCFGMLLGQSVWPAKICPEISPKKSWAGVIGGLLTCLLAAWILHRVGWLPFPLAHVLVVAALMHVAGIFGDLFESLWKRSFDLKDSGQLLPGHGGLLDRFDSALFAIPVAVAYLFCFGLI